MSTFTKSDVEELLCAAVVRAVWTFCEVLASLLIVDGAYHGFGDYAWGQLLSVAGVSALASFLKCIVAGVPEASGGQSLAKTIEEDTK